MSRKLYITSTEAKSGKSLVALGIMELLLRNIGKVGFFRPFISAQTDDGKKDNDIRLISETYNLDIPYQDMYAYTLSEVSQLMVDSNYNQLIEDILKKIEPLAEKYDFIMCEGTDFSSTYSSFELDINAEIANNLGASVLLVANVYKKSVSEIIHSIEISIDSLTSKGNKVIATFVNRVNSKYKKEIVSKLSEKYKEQDIQFYTIPSIDLLKNPTIKEIADILDAKVLYGETRLNQHVHNYVVAAMHLNNFLERIHHGSLIITPGDRADIIVACLSAVSSINMPYIAGIVLTGGIEPAPSVLKLIKGLKKTIPIISVKTDTFLSARIIDKIHAVITPGDNRKVNLALAVFEQNVDMDQLGGKIINSYSITVTPKMFEYSLLATARVNKQHIVLPEGKEHRILRAAEILLRREVADITLLGNRKQIESKIIELGLKMDGVNIIEPGKSEYFNEYIEQYYELRKHKGVTKDKVSDILLDVNFFGTMMVYNGHADGLVSGSIHTTAATIRPAFQIIKTKPGCKIVSSVMLMCLKDRVLVYGDCAINPNPDSEELAEIALSSAKTARMFNIEPRIAMLSYSTGDSGTGDDVELVRNAVRIAREKAKHIDPDLKIEGPIQYDAAIDPDVAKTKMPESEVAGKATIFIFPDLNTGNNTYKAVQRSAKAIAIGPILQGLKKPVNDLSRGCLIPDIINTVAITAIQAQTE